MNRILEHSHIDELYSSDYLTENILSIKIKIHNS